MPLAEDPEALARWISDRLHRLELPWEGIEELPGVAVVGVDPSKASRRAALWAARLADEVHLVAGLAEEVPAFVKAADTDVLEGWHGRAQEGGSRLLDEVKSDLTSAGEVDPDRVQGHLVDTSAAEAIVSVAREQTADLVTVGRSSRDRIERMVLGSVAAQVAHQAPCSVLVAGQPQRQGPVVVGVGGGETTAPAAGWGARMAMELGTELVLAHAAPESYAPPGYRDVEGDAEALSVDWPPRKELVGLAKERKAQLLVVGHGRRPGWLGSTALGVLHRAESSVLVAKRWRPG